MRKDLITSLVLIAFGVAVVVEALRMPRFDHLGVNPYTIPGIVPAFLGAILGFMGLLMLGRTVVAWRRGGTVPTTAADGEPNSAPRLLLTLALALVFGFVLIGNVPFWLATFLFVWSFLLVFEVQPVLAARAGRTALLRSASATLLEAVLVAAIVTFVFQRVFLVTLP